MGGVSSTIRKFGIRNGDLKWLRESIPKIFGICAGQFFIAKDICGLKEKTHFIQDKRHCKIPVWVRTHPKSELKMLNISHTEGGVFTGTFPKTDESDHPNAAWTRMWPISPDLQKSKRVNTAALIWQENAPLKKHLEKVRLMVGCHAESGNAECHKALMVLFGEAMRLSVSPGLCECPTCVAASLQSARRSSSQSPPAQHSLRTPSEPKSHSTRPPRQHAARDGQTRPLKKRDRQDCAVSLTGKLPNGKDRFRQRHASKAEAKLHANVHTGSTARLPKAGHTRLTRDQLRNLPGLDDSDSSDDKPGNVYAVARAGEPQPLPVGLATARRLVADSPACEPSVERSAMIPLIIVASLLVLAGLTFYLFCRYLLNHAPSSSEEEQCDLEGDALV